MGNTCMSAHWASSQLSETPSSGMCCVRNSRTGHRLQILFEASGVKKRRKRSEAFEAFGHLFLDPEDWSPLVSLHFWVAGWAQATSWLRRLRSLRCKCHRLPDAAGLDSSVLRGKKWKEFEGNFERIHHLNGLYCGMSLRVTRKGLRRHLLDPTRSVLLVS